MMQDELERILEPTIKDMGFELWGCEYLAQGKHSLLRVYIDKDGGIGIEDCQAVSHQVSALLDVEDPIPGNYSLEVSSPGVPRPMFRYWQYQRYIGQEVQIKLFKPVEGKRRISGLISSANESTLTIKLDGKPLEILFANIVKAHLTV